MSKGLTISHMASHPPDARYPDATAITYDEQNFKVTVVYNDHSVYVWDVRDIKKVILFKNQFLEVESFLWESGDIYANLAILATA